MLWRAGPAHVVALGVLVVVLGLLPTAIILATGELVGALPAAVEHGLGSADGTTALLALAAVIVGWTLRAFGHNAAGYLRQVLDSAFTSTFHETIARSVLGTRGVAPLERPEVTGELAALEDAERRGQLRSTVSTMSNIAMSRLTGLSALIVLLGLRWWAPLLLASVWQLVNLSYRRASAKGVTVGISEGASEVRRSEYLRGLAVGPGAAKEVRVFGLAGWVVGQYADAWSSVLGAIWRSRRANRLLTAVVVAAILLAHGLVLLTLSRDVNRGAIGVGEVAVFVQAAVVSFSFGWLGDMQWWLTRSLDAVERVERLGSLLATTDPVRPTPPDRRRTDGAVDVRLRDVSFTYHGRSRPTLDRLNVHVAAGQSTAIVGANGAGKSTMVKLLCGLYEPDSGRVLLDGLDAEVAARGRVAVIFQDFVRYELSLRANVGFGSLTTADDDVPVDDTAVDPVAAALRDAGGAELLARLPNGWDTVLARGYDGGVDLSGGEWQRVALARALAAVRGGAGLLILDEPTANLDVRAETELFEQFLDLTRGTTTILVSHRLSSVRRADRILVVHDRRIVEDGSHQELIAQEGRYARMFALQAQRFAVEEPAAVPSGPEVVRDA
nr:ABC transporter ATP-binding protein [Actinopolymorpha pittospori]